MSGCTANFAVLLVQLFYMFQKLLGSDEVEIFGLRMNKYPAEVIKNSEVSFTVFGINLPRDGYFLSTTDRCEDSESSEILDKMIIRLKTDSVFKNAVRLNAPNGVPFSEKYITFQLCNKGAVSLNKMMLQVTAPRGKSMATTWLLVLLCSVTLIISAYCSGANFAYMRMSINDMVLIMDNGEEPHKTHARKIFKYRKQSNWLICTMAVMNILVNSIFTIAVSWLLEEHKYSDILKYVVPTVMIVLLAEILPQSVCNRSGLKLAAKTRHITLLLFIICAPVAWPLSKIIDCVLGREVREIFSEEKLKTLIKVQSKKMEEGAQGDILARIVDFPKKTVQEMMTPLEDAYVLSGSDTLDLKLLVTILEKGYTRIPVFEDKNTSNISTVLNVKDLATMTIDQKWTVQEVISRVDPVRSQIRCDLRILGVFQMRFVLASQRGESLMQEMIKGEHHLCAVVRFSYSRYKVIGIITFEDVIEEVFGDIEDDSDKLWNSRRAGIHKDQRSLEWFRETESERGAALQVNAMLKLIQTTFAVCPLFATLGYDILRLKELLDIKKLKFSEENEIIKPYGSRKVLIFFSGSISVRSGKTTVYRLDANRSDFRPYIWGKSLERLHALSCLAEPLGLNTAPAYAEILCFTRVGYYEISLSDILNGLIVADEVGYDYIKQFKLSGSGADQTNEGYTQIGGRDEKQHTDAECTQVSHSRITTPTRNSERILKYTKTVKPSDLRANLESLQTDGNSSPTVTEFVTVDTSEWQTITAREPIVHPGPPVKEALQRFSTKTTKEQGRNSQKTSAPGSTYRSTRKAGKEKNAEVIPKVVKHKNESNNPGNIKKVKTKQLKSHINKKETNIPANKEGKPGPENESNVNMKKKFSFLPFTKRK